MPSTHPLSCCSSANYLTRKAPCPPELPPRTSGMRVLFNRMAVNCGIMPLHSSMPRNRPPEVTGNSGKVTTPRLKPTRRSQNRVFVHGTLRRGEDQTQDAGYKQAKLALPLLPLSAPSCTTSAFLYMPLTFYQSPRLYTDRRKLGVQPPRLTSNSPMCKRAKSGGFAHWRCVSFA